MKRKTSGEMRIQVIAAGVVTALAALAVVVGVTAGETAWWVAPLWAATAAVWSWTAVLKQQQVEIYKRLAEDRGYDKRTWSP